MATFRVTEKESQKELGLYDGTNSSDAIQEAKEDPKNESSSEELEAFEISLAC